MTVAVAESRQSCNHLILLCCWSIVHCCRRAPLGPGRHTLSCVIFVIFAPCWAAAFLVVFLLYWMQSTMHCHHHRTPPPLCRSQHHLTSHPLTAVILFLFVVFVAASSPPANGWLLCVGQTRLDIVNLVIASWLSRHHHHSHPYCSLIVVFTPVALPPPIALLLSLLLMALLLSTTAANVNSFEADKGGWLMYCCHCCLLGWCLHRHCLPALANLPTGAVEGGLATMTTLNPRQARAAAAAAVWPHGARGPQQPPSIWLRRARRSLSPLSLSLSLSLSSSVLPPTTVCCCLPHLLIVECLPLMLLPIVVPQHPHPQMWMTSLSANECHLVVLLCSNSSGYKKNNR